MCMIISLYSIIFIWVLRLDLASMCHHVFMFVSHCHNYKYSSQSAKVYVKVYINFNLPSIMPAFSQSFSNLLTNFASMPSCTHAATAPWMWDWSSRPPIIAQISLPSISHTFLFFPSETASIKHYSPQPLSTTFYLMSLNLISLDTS